MNSEANEHMERNPGHPSTDERLAAELERQKSLLAETRRRFRNTFAIIRSIMRLSVSSSDNVEEFVSHLDGRIDALCRVQFAVVRDPVAGFDLAELISDEMLACAAREGEQFTLNGPAVRLQAKAAESTSLAIHELATNALKYGALSVPRGRVDINWSTAPRANHTWLSLDWKESGMNGRPVVESRRGFGATLLEDMLKYDFGAEVTRMFNPDGFRCEIAFPLVANAATDM